MYPQVYIDFDKHRQQFDNTSVFPTPAFFYGIAERRGNRG